MFDSLGATRSFLEDLIRVPLTDFEVLAGGFHCQTLAFRAQEHALVLKISRNDKALFIEQSIREHFGAHPPVPIPPVFFKGYQQGWAWIVQARCAGQSLSQHLTLGRLQSAIQTLVHLHQWREKPPLSDAKQWSTFLHSLHGFLPAEIRPGTPLTLAMWSDYGKQLNALLSVYEAPLLGEHKEKVLCWIHGDLKPDHCFVDEALCGVIDWEMFRVGDFMYDWAVFLLYAPVPLTLAQGAEETVDAIAVLRCFLIAYGPEAFEFRYLNARLKACALHSALGALFMWSQTQQIQRYQSLKLRLDRFLQTDFTVALS